MNPDDIPREPAGPHRPDGTPRRIVAMVPDLFFATRIATVARHVGATLEPVGPGALVEACRRDPPDLVILDLHATGDPVALARALKADPATRGVPIVGFCSHVEEELRRAAAEAGVDRVLARSAFTVKLPELLRGD